MKDIIRFTQKELHNKFPGIVFELKETEIDHILVKVKKGQLSNSVSVNEVIRHYWNTYQPEVNSQISFEVENHSMDNEKIVSEIYQPNLRH
jgi:DNA-binding protein